MPSTRRIPRPPAATDRAPRPLRGLVASLLLPVALLGLAGGAWSAYRAARPAPLPVDGAVASGAPAAAPTARKILMLRVYFDNYPNASRYTKAQVEGHLATMNDLWRQTSYDKTEMDFTVTEQFQVPGDDDDYVDWSKSSSSGAQFIQLVEDAVAAAPAGTSFDDLDGIVVLMADPDPSHWHRGRAGKLDLPIGPDGADVSIKCAIFLENASDADDKVWGRWQHEIGHVFQVAGPSHPSAYNNAFEIMDANYPGQTGVFSKLATQGFPGWLPESKYVAFTPSASVGPAAAGLGGGLASVWAMEYDPAGKPNPQAVQAFVTDSVYYLVSMRRRVLGDDINSSNSPAGIPDEGVLIERVVEGGDPDNGQWVTLQPPPGGDRNDLWQCGQTFTNPGDGVEIAIGREVVRELVLGATADAWIREGDAINHGAVDDLYVGNFVSPEGGFDGRFRSLVRFDVSTLPPGATIESATLELRALDVAGNQDVSVAALRVEAPWAEGAVTWANQPAAAALTTAISSIDDDPGLKTWDVKKQVEDWQGGIANNGLLLRAVSENDNVIPRHFYSREHLELGTGGASSYKPRLRIVYTQTCPPEDDDPDQAYVRVSYDPGASQPDVHISPWRTAPLDAWESTDLWIDSPVNGFGTYRSGTWATPWGDAVPYWNGDEPTVGSANRVVARVRNVGTQNAVNVVVHIDITNPPGLGISGADGFTNLGTVDAGDFPGLALIPPGGYTDVWVEYKPEVDLDEQAIEDGFFAFHTCFRVRVDPVAGETILGNQDGEEEQENVFWYEVPVDDDAGGAPPAPFGGSIHLRNFDAARPREFTLYHDAELADGWRAVVNDGAQSVTLGPAAEYDVPVALEPPVPLPKIASTARVDVAAAYIKVLTNDLLAGHEHEHHEVADLGGVTVVGGVVADTDTRCVAEREGDNVAVHGWLTAAAGEPVGRTVVYVRGDVAGHTALASVARDGTFDAVLEDPAGAQGHVDCLFGGTRRLGRSADAAVPVPPPSGVGGPTPGAPAAVLVAVAPERAVVAPGALVTAVLHLPAPPRAPLESVKLTLSFDPAVARVVDADDRKPGVQVLPGAALAGYALTTNAADNRAGTLEVVAERGNARTASDRQLLVVAFEAVAVGTTRVQLEEAALATADGELAVALRSGTLRVTDDPALVAFRIGGHVRVLDGLTGAHAGTRVCHADACATTDADGAFLLEGVHLGDAIWTERAGFLTRRWVADAPPRAVGGTVAWPDAVVVPGDIDGDGIVGLADGVAVLGAVGASRQARRYLLARDLNRDGTVDAADVAWLAAHWGERADPVPGAVERGDAGRPALLRTAAARDARFAPAIVAQRGEDGDAPTVRVVPARSSVAVGDVLTVEVRAEGVKALYGAALEIGFDPSLLAVVDAEPATRAVEVAPGEVFPSADRTVLVNAVDARAGRVTFAAGLTGAVPGVAGDGALVRIVLRALAPGGSDLRVIEAELRDDAYPDSAVIRVAVAHGMVDVRPAAPAEPTAAPTEPPARTPAPGTTPTATDEPPARPTATDVAAPTAELTPPPSRPTPAPTSTSPADAASRRTVWLPWAMRPR